MALFLRKLPFNDVLILLKGEHAGKATDEMARWGEGIQRQASAAPVAPNPAERLGAPAAGPPLTASASGTIGGAIPSGMYTVYVYREVLVADPVSSSLNGTINFTHNGKALTRSLATFGGAPQTINDNIGDVIPIETDPNTGISYTLTYASNTPALAGFQVTLLANLMETVG